MKRYELLPHTADIKIRAFGRDERELFANALLGMSEIQKAEVEGDEEIKREIKVAADDLPSLLVDFLNEALYLSLVNQEVYPEIELMNFSRTGLSGELLGKRVKSFGEDIKAVTYYALKISRNKDGLWEATIVFDV